MQTVNGLLPTGSHGASAIPNVHGAGRGTLIDGATGQVIPGGSTGAGPAGGVTGPGVNTGSRGGTVLDRAGNAVGAGNATGTGGRMDWLELLEGGTRLAGALFQNSANNDSSRAVAAAAALEERARNQARADLEKGYQRAVTLNKPGTTAYNDALGILDPLLTKGTVKGRGRNISAEQWMQRVDPGYRFRFSEGERALSTRQAAAGDRLSGRANKELVRYGQGYASSEFGNSVNRLQNLAALGDTATGRLTNAAMGVGTNNASLTVDTGTNNLATLFNMVAHTGVHTA